MKVAYSKRPYAWKANIWHNLIRRSHTAVTHGELHSRNLCCQIINTKVAAASICSVHLNVQVIHNAGLVRWYHVENSNTMRKDNVETCSQVIKTWTHRHHFSFVPHLANQHSMNPQLAVSTKAVGLAITLIPEPKAAMGKATFSHLGVPSCIQNKALRYFISPTKMHTI